jgi:phospholipase/carboxylesterase
MTLHAGQPILSRGKPLTEAQSAMILLHGRGASAASILQLVPEFDRPDYAYLAPQAAGNSWYPYRFIEPVVRNEPYLSSALAVIAELIKHINTANIPTERIMLLGFSQGACLTLEFAARNAACYRGVAGLSGGLIGADDTPRDYPGSLDGTPVFLGCSDVDPHIPKARVDETAQVLAQLGGTVTERIYPDMDHVVNQDEIDFVKTMMK